MSRRIPSEVLKQLAAVPLFSRCSQRELRLIASLGSEISVRAGEPLTVEGRTGSEFCLLRNGEATCHVGDREVARQGPGEYFGELALLTSRPRTATVRAVTDAAVVVLDRREFFALLDEAPSIARKMLSVLAERLSP